MDEITRQLINGLGEALAPYGYDAGRIEDEIAARKAAAERHNARAAARNVETCRRAVGKPFTVRTSKTTTISGTVAEARVVNGRFEVYLLQSGQYRQGPYYVKALPR